MPQKTYGERELELLKQVFATRNLGAVGGKFTPLFEEKFAQAIGTKYAVAMNGAMSVLHSSVLCSGAGAGTEVICDPVFVFGPVAVLYSNAVPKFVDIDPVTHNLNPEKLEAAINEKTKAVIVTHAWGLPARMDRIVEIAHRYKLLVIEDCAHAIFAEYKGKRAGNWGDIGSFSFQAAKQFSLGDGGMATTNNEKIAKELDLNAGAPTFHSVAYGLNYNYRMNEQTSAIGIAQLERFPEYFAGIRKNAGYFTQAVSGCKWLVPQTSPDTVHAYHIWVATFDGKKAGLEAAEFLKMIPKFGIRIMGLGYTGMPAYRHPVFKDKLAHAFHCPINKGLMDYPEGLCPVAEEIIPRMVLCYTDIPEDMAKEEAEKISRLVDEVGRN